MSDEHGEIESKSAYEIERQWYLDKYGSDVSKPSDQLKVSIVIPTFAELESNNFWRMLRSLMYQREVDQRCFDVICVVNNSEEVSRISNPDEMKSDKFEGHSSEKRLGRFQENKNQLSILKIINEAKDMLSRDPDSTGVDHHIDSELKRQNVVLSEYEIDLMKRMARTKIKLNFVDASSPGRGFEKSDQKSPISLARDIGSFIAYKRFKEIGKDGIIDFIDGDCFLDPKYIATLVDHLEKGADIIVKPLKKVVAEIPRDIALEPDRKKRILSGIKYLATSLGGSDYHIGIVEGIDSKGRYNISTILGGPQVSIKASCLAEVGGYPTVRSNGDWRFSEKVVRKYQGQQIQTMTDSSVIISDRGRDVSIDGINRSSLAGGIDHITERDPDTNSESTWKIETMISYEVGLMNDIDHIHSTRMSPITHPEGLKLEYERLKEELFQKASAEKKLLIKRIEKVVKDIVQIDYRSIDPKILIETLENNHKLKPSDKDFLEENKLLTEIVLEAVCMAYEGGNKENINHVRSTMEVLSMILPEYFKTPPEHSPELSKTADNNLGDYRHIPTAQYLMRSRIRNRTWGIGN